MERNFFEMIVYIIDKYWLWFLQGAGTTLLIALSGTIVGFAIGLLIGVVRTIPVPENVGKYSPKRILIKLVNALLVCYIEVFRGTPMIVQATVIYFGLMEVYQIDLSPLFAAFLIVSINTGAYMAELVRGGIQSIDPGQKEAAHAVGMTHMQSMINVVLPQTIRNILPATGNEFVINIKDTAVLNVIAVTELFFMTKSVKGALARTYEVFLISGAIYLVLTLSVTAILRYFERKLDGPDSYTVFGSSTMPDSSFKKNLGKKNN